PAKKAVAEKAPAEAEKLGKTALNAMKKAELADYASTQGVEVNASDTKAQMIEKLT
ncbi:MAG TPA: 30S ribosomal protein S2, partial [Gammaproteobacteria bacterium]|nr:30S ribosomal protein S2 [Gammaproteobacteria bacterium]HCJ78249.1 30S ribosomal protein S2 [Gammaproteobacteria bacterium]